MENKTGRYFKYALGEIVLVVIGILIALSINNWNESNKNSAIKTIYTQSILNDIYTDTTEYNYYIKLLSQRQETISHFKNLIRNRELNVHQLSDSLSKYGNLKMGYNPATATFNDLINTGNISLFSTAEKQAIFNFYRWVEYNEEIIDQNEQERKYERRESLRYLNETDDTLDFYASLEVERNQTQLVQGIKHRLNEMNKETQMLRTLKDYKELYFSVFKTADSILKK